MKVIKNEIIKLAESFNSKMVAEGSIIRLVKLDYMNNISFEITINEDKYIGSKIINATDLLRDLIESHFKEGGHNVRKWNNDGSIFSIDTMSKINKEVNALAKQDGYTAIGVRFFAYEESWKTLYAVMMMKDSEIRVCLYNYERFNLLEGKKFTDAKEASTYFESNKLLD